MSERTHDLSLFADALAIRCGCSATRDYHPAAGDIDVSTLGKLAEYFPEGRLGASRTQALLTSDALANIIDGTVRRIAGDTSRYDASHRSIATLLTAENFKPTTIMRVLGSELVKRPEGAAARTLPLTTAQETVSVESYAGSFVFTREAAISSAWDALAGSVAELVAGGYRKERSLLVAQMDANPTMADGIAQFAEARGNVQTGELSIDTLSSAIAKLKALPGADGNPLQTAPAWLAVPTTKQVQASTLLDAAGLRDVRVWSDTRLTAGYLLADPRVSPAFAILHLTGNRGPLTGTRLVRSADYWQIKAVHDVAVAAISTRAVKLTLEA